MNLRPDKPYRIAVNGRFLTQPVTGVQRVAREIVKALDAILPSQQGVSMVLYCPPGADHRSLALSHTDVRSIGRSSGAIWEQTELPFAVEADVLLCLGNSAPCGRLLARKRTAVMIHDLSYLKFPQAYRAGYRIFHRLMLPLITRHSSRLFLVSNSERDNLLEIKPRLKPRVTVVPNGSWSEHREKQADTAELQCRAHACPKDGYGLYVGSFSKRKNFERVVETAISLARTEELPFVFVGSGGKVLRRTKMTIPEDVRHLLHFEGQVDDLTRLGELYRNARLLLFPSLYEACPMPPLEAAHFDCPVVASNIPSMWERCAEGVTYCDPYSVESIASAAREVLANGKQIRQRLQTNRENSRQVSWARQAESVLQTLLSDAGIESCSK